MTTLNNDELRQQILDYCYKHGATSEYIDETIQPVVQLRVDRFVDFIATHDQQLLEAILEGVKDKEIRQHIKSVFQKEGE